jgi:hypothetical protein
MSKRPRRDHSPAFKAKSLPPRGRGWQKRMAHPVCNGDFGTACWSASTYPVSGV